MSAVASLRKLKKAVRDQREALKMIHDAFNDIEKDNENQEDPLSLVDTLMDACSIWSVLSYACLASCRCYGNTYNPCIIVCCLWVTSSKGCPGCSCKSLFTM